MSKVISVIASWLLEAAAESHTARSIAEGTGLSLQQVYNGVHYLCNIGALDKKQDGAGRLAGIYTLDDIDQLRRRTDGSARRARIENPVEERPPLAFFIDDEGDLQLVREGEAPVLIRNADARRLVAFVATQATAILTGG